MARSLLSKAALGDIVRFLTAETLKMVKEFAENAEASGEILARLQMGGDFEDDGQGNISFQGRAKTNLPQEPVAGELEAGLKRGSSRSGDAAVEILFQIIARVN